MKNYKLTVFIPTFNRSHLLEKSIKSVLEQSYKNYSIIVIDNASTDRTESVVHSFKSDKIQYLKNDKNIGPIGNFNRAIELAETEYFLIFHDDDIMKPEFLYREIEILNQFSDVVVVASNIELMNDNETFIAAKALNINKDTIFNQYEYFYNFFDKDIYLPCPTVMFRTDFIKKNKLKFEEKVGACADAYLWNEINTYQVKIYLISDSLVRYRTQTVDNIQMHPFIGKNYRNQFLLFKYSYLLALKKNRDKTKNLIIKRKNKYFNLLLDDYKNDRIKKHELFDEIKEDDFLISELSFILKIKYFIVIKMRMLVKTTCT